MINRLMSLFAILFCLTMIGHADANVGVQNLKQRANAPVFKKLYKGVNVDSSTPENGVWFKVQHEPGHFKAAAEAGFESVRVFMPYKSNIESKEAQIKDAFEHNLAIVVCMWGSYEWDKMDADQAAAQIAKRWRQLAER